MSLPFEDPFSWFAAWFEEATRSEPDVPDAMQVATVTPEGLPAVRTVLLKAHGPDGFVFFTHYDAPKSRDLAVTPYVAAVLHHKSLARQLHVRGPVARLDEAASDAYFASRPRGSQLGAWASAQSEPLDSRAALLARCEAADARFPGEVPRPAGWGGWRIQPDAFEFWQGRDDRLHERWRWRRLDDRWTATPLQP